MSTDLTTCLLLWEPGNDVRADGGCAALRFFREKEGGLGIRGALAKVDTEGFGVMRLNEEDAIMLRDWLNDEWPVMDAEPVEDRALWGGDFGFPLEGCACPQCERARGR